MTPVLITKTILVPLTPSDAFVLFTDGMGKWWPHAHGNLHMEPRKGGKIKDGTKDIGTIIAFDPDGFLAFSWSPDDADETIVTVVFSASSDGCRVDLTHGSEVILGDVTDAVSTSYLRGFDLILGSYCICANRVFVVA
ncbi:Activator of Hsp90 ATPase homolog 1-like protein [Cognatiyoonia koreensis]|uniref:Activator of Hsp90 ATPase homolog 1-like protein n=1 Tax=Cognatiyoonia koreensis TaxID=364200 RepID=A0A1I0Q138_9RHOB|nr:SRPBCC domain-containing protein [Cognatiyoonia koreensis]SEW20495.1 Activator of Hsp90 ATPase homolog 1-like protein [Cognatiyoonia koreensis]